MIKTIHLVVSSVRGPAGHGEPGDAFTIDRKWHEARGYRAVKVAVVRWEA